MPNADQSIPAQYFSTCEADIHEVVLLFPNDYSEIYPEKLIKSNIFLPFPLIIGPENSTRAEPAKPPGQFYKGSILAEPQVGTNMKI